MWTLGSLAALCVRAVVCSGSGYEMDRRGTKAGRLGWYGSTRRIFVGVVDGPSKAAEIRAGQ